MADNSGTYNKFRTKIPALGDNANIQDALQTFLYGSTGNASADPDTLVATSSTDTSAGLVGHLQVLETTAGQAAPTGSITQFAGTVLPSGWLWCNGAETNRTEYADLFDVIGVTYGNGNGSTTFNVPNLKGRVPAGLDSSQTEFDTLGEAGGAKTHTLSSYQVPHHAHYAWSGYMNQNWSHAHSMQFHLPWYRLKTYGDGNVPEYYGVWRSGYGSNTAVTDTNHTHNISMNGEGGNPSNGYATDPHNNLQPYIVLNYIIKT